MRYSVVNYNLILKECKSEDDIQIIRHTVLEDMNQYSSFELKMIEEAITKKEKELIKL